jgi:hypothetical protein
VTILALKILIVLSAVGTLRSFERFRTMSRELDEAAFGSMKRIMRVAEESGYPPAVVPILMLLSAMTLMLVLGATAPFGR